MEIDGKTKSMMKTKRSKGYGFCKWLGMKEAADFEGKKMKDYEENEGKKDKGIPLSQIGS